MARIANVNIPSNKRLLISLTYIYGIGKSLAKQICKKAGVSEDKKVHELNDQELKAIRDVISEDSYKVEGDLRKEVTLNIKKKKDIKCYQGIRHNLGLPVRGQNTRSNACTRKPKSAPIANKKKATK